MKTVRGIKIQVLLLLVPNMDSLLFYFKMTSFLSHYGPLVSFYTR